MKSLPSTNVSIIELQRRPSVSGSELDGFNPLLTSLFSSDSATVSVLNENNHESGMPVRHFNVYITATDAVPNDLDALEVMNMNDKEFVLSIGGVAYFVRLDQIQRVHPSCVCLCLVTVAHQRPSNLPWYLRWFGACMPRRLFPSPAQFFMRTA